MNIENNFHFEFSFSFLKNNFHFEFSFSNLGEKEKNSFWISKKIIIFKTKNICYNIYVRRKREKSSKNSQKVAKTKQKNFLLTVEYKICYNIYVRKRENLLNQVKRGWPPLKITSLYRKGAEKEHYHGWEDYP